MNHAGLIALSVVGAGVVLLPSRWLLPPITLIALLLLIGVAALVLHKRVQLMQPRSVHSRITGSVVWAVVMLCTGAAVSIWQVNQALQHRVPASMIGEDVRVRVTLNSVVDERPVRQVIVADTVSLPESFGVGSQPRRWRINWYGMPKHPMVHR